jgi:predicted nucleic acid-binding protein
MSAVLLDTNVISELVRPKPEPRVAAFVKSQSDPILSALTIHELAYGADRAADPTRRAKLKAWLAAIRAQFAGRIVDIDASVAEHAGRIRAAAANQGASPDPIDTLIAACAIARGAAIATRNVRDFAAFGAALLDPWAS